MDGTGGGQHGVVSTAASSYVISNFHMLDVRHMMYVRIPSIKQIDLMHSECQWVKPEGLSLECNVGYWS